MDQANETTPSVQNCVVHQAMTQGLMWRHLQCFTEGMQKHLLAWQFCCQWFCFHITTLISDLYHSGLVRSSMLIRPFGFSLPSLNRLLAFAISPRIFRLTVFQLSFRYIRPIKSCHACDGVSFFSGNSACVLSIRKVLLQR